MAIKQFTIFFLFLPEKRISGAITITTVHCSYYQITKALCRWDVIIVTMYMYTSLIQQQSMLYKL